MTGRRFESAHVFPNAQNQREVALTPFDLRWRAVVRPLVSSAFCLAASALAACGGGSSVQTLPATAGAGLGSQPYVAATVSSTAPTANLYQNVVLGDAPSAFYVLDDTGKVAEDSGSNHLNGVVGSSVKSGAASLLTSSTNSAMSFPGAQSAAGAVRVSAAAPLQPSAAVSLEAWLKFSSTPANYTVVAAYGRNSGLATYELYFKNGEIVAQDTLASGLAIVVSPSALRANTVYHVVETYDGAYARLYINGALAGTSSPRAGTLSYESGYGFSIGDDATSSNPAFEGTIGDVAVYAKALTAAQVENHYKAGTSSDPTPTPKPTSAPTSTPAPTPTPVTRAAQASVATYDGCNVFTAGDYYNAPVTNASVDSNSAAYIASMQQAGNTAGFFASTGVEKVNDATDATPMMTVQPQVSYHSFPVPYPWSPSFYIEPLGDAHAMVVQTQSCHLYESYGTKYSGGVLSAYSGVNYDLSQPFTPLAPGTPSSMASGLSFFAGMVKWEDYESGSIDHALNWAAPAHTVAQWLFVKPASDTDQLPFNGTGLQLPYGAHLRLKASFSTAGWGPEATAVANAMKTYGIYLADTDSSSNALYFANASDGSDPWNSSDLAKLGSITIGDFDVIALPTIETIPGH